MTPLDYCVVVAFLATMAIGGFWISRLIRDSDDFFVAGRELTPFILAATITATNLSMFHFIGMGGIACRNGISIIWQNWTGDIALVLSGIFVLPIMRRLRIRSIPEFLELRYGRGLRTLVGAFWALRLCVYLGILLYIAATAAVVITGWNNYAAWLMVFSLISVLYSVIGGAWAVAIMDSVQFVIMLAGAAIVFPIAMHLAGGIPEMLEFFRRTKPQQIDWVPAKGDFNWLFITSILLLGFKFSTIDQSILQRAFGARTPRIGAQAMVLSGLITTALAFLWILPGLAVAKLHPEPFATPDHAIPWLLSMHVPPVAKGLLGVVLCGLVAAQVSTITADVNSVATLLTSDVYRTLRFEEPTQQQLLRVVRLSSLACGVLMLVIAWLLQFDRTGAVNINLVMVGILDMPLFVIAIPYGLWWRRMNWQGATAGFVVGGVAGVACYWWMDRIAARNAAPLISTATAMLVAPLIALMTRPDVRDNRDQVWAAIALADHNAEESKPFHLVPKSRRGKISVIAVMLGLCLFLAGVLSGAVAFEAAGKLAVLGMVIVLLGGAARVCCD